MGNVGSSIFGSSQAVSLMTVKMAAMAVCSAWVKTTPAETKMSNIFQRDIIQFWFRCSVSSDDAAGVQSSQTMCHSCCGYFTSSESRSEALGDPVPLVGRSGGAAAPTLIDGASPRSNAVGPQERNRVSEQYHDTYGLYNPTRLFVCVCVCVIGRWTKTRWHFCFGCAIFALLFFYFM